MARQYNTTLRNEWITTYKTQIGTAPTLRMLTGSPPANCAAAQTGTALVDLTLPSTWLGTPSGGVASLSGTWSGTISATGVAGYYRIIKTGTTWEQGVVTQAFTLSTSASTAAASNVLTFSSTTGVTVGMSVTGTGVPADATVLALTSTTVTLSQVSTTGVASSAAIYFGSTDGDMWLTSTLLTSGQPFEITDLNFTAPGA